MEKTLNISLEYDKNIRSLASLQFQFIRLLIQDWKKCCQRPFLPQNGRKIGKSSISQLANRTRWIHGWLRVNGDAQDLISRVLGGCCQEVLEVLGVKNPQKFRHFWSKKLLCFKTNKPLKSKYGGPLEPYGYHGNELDMIKQSGFFTQIANFGAFKFFLTPCTLIFFSLCEIWCFIFLECLPWQLIKIFSWLTNKKRLKIFHQKCDFLTLYIICYNIKRL